MQEKIKNEINKLCIEGLKILEKFIEDKEEVEELIMGTDKIIKTIIKNVIQNLTKCKAKYCSVRIFIHSKKLQDYILHIYSYV